MPFFADVPLALLFGVLCSAGALSTGVLVGVAGKVELDDDAAAFLPTPAAALA